MKRLTIPFCALVLIAACGDSETTATAGSGGSGGSAGPKCDTNADCIAGDDCKSGEAAVTSCVAGTCQTACESGFAECTACATPAECTFAGDLCPPPNTDPHQNCFEGKCSEFCGVASDTFCLNDGECPKIRCPGNADAIAQCIGGGCMDAARRCCAE